MGADTFFTLATGKTAADAFVKAREGALYWNGHRGYTGTIAEKDDFKVFGEISTRYLDYLEDYMWRISNAMYPPMVRKGDKMVPGKPRKAKVPEPIRDKLEKAAPYYEEEWGPAVCFQLVGSRVPEIKEKLLGRKGSHDKVFVFCGYASC